MKNHLYFKTALICGLILLSSCNQEDYLTENSVKKDAPIVINTTRSVGNILGKNYLQTRVGGDDPFTNTREVESFETVILPELQPHIWLGNILTKESIIDCVYKPLPFQKIPLTVSSTLPNGAPATIDNLTYSKYLKYIQNQVDKATFTQNNEFNYTIEQFSSYNELKTAFGSNVSTGSLFWKSNKTSEGYDYSVTKATGLYVKFYQTSFKAVLDYPSQGQIAAMPEDLKDQAVYVNSITYGRLGILTIETNEAVDSAQNKLNSTFKKIFSSGTSFMTATEKAFLDGCVYKVYLIGGNGSTSVETFSGYDGFIQHIKKGIFTKDEPGAPIFCTFNHVKDNSPVSVKFKYNIKKEPLYIEMKWKELDFPKSERNHGDVIVYFYRNAAKVPTIPSPNIKIKLICKHSYTILEPPFRDNVPEVSEITNEFQNSGYNTSMILLKNTYTIFIDPPRMTGPPWDREWDNGRREQNEYFMPSNSDYIVLGNNVINAENTK